VKVAVVGANGQLGIDVCQELLKNSNDVIDLNHKQIEISSIDSVMYVMREIRPDIIINTAAIHNVEQCESAPEKAFAVNGLGSRNLSIISNEINATLIYISTDYVFDGFKNSPYIESDRPIPLNVYGNTKLSGEHFIQTIAKKYFILRTSGLYGKNPCRAKGGLNFIDLMLKLAGERDEIRVVDDEILTPTSTASLARQIATISESDAYGLYHATAEGSCSWYEFAKEIFSITNIKVKLNVANPNEFPVKTPRPKYSVIENERLKSVGSNIFSKWHNELAEYLRN